MALRRATGAALAGLSAATAYRYNQVKTREQNLPTNKLTAFKDMEPLPATTRNWIPFWSRPSPAVTTNPQKVVVIGAGVVGVSTAYKLAEKGHQVVVLEPMPQPGEECSACAAGGMSRQNVVVDKNTWLAVLKCLAPRPVQRLVWGQADDFAFFRIDWFSSLSDPFFLRWAWTFTHTSLFPNVEQQDKQKHMLQFTKFAVQDMVNMFEDPRDNMKDCAGYNSRGSLAVSYDEPEGSGSPSPFPDDKPKVMSSENDEDNKNYKDSPPKELKLSLEPNRRIEGTEAVLKEEPSLKFQKIPPTSAKFEYEAKAASSGRFAKELARRCVNDPSLDVSFIYDTKVLGVDTSKSNSAKHRITALRTNHGVIDVSEDMHVVVTAGAWTPHILALMDLYAPVYPLKGYAMSVSAKQALAENTELLPQDLPSRIVCDKYMYTTRLGDEIRITSIGEFSEWNTKPSPEVDENFRQEAMRQFPQLSSLISQATTYCGHRPYVSDGILLLGACSDTYDNLYVSCGPGSNGWKLAMGSGEVVARLVSGEKIEQMEEELGFDANAFSPQGRVLDAPTFAKICRARWNI
jgi:D-amino-acid dehydrogenase